MVQVVGERGRRRDVGDHAGLRGQRARHQPHLQLGAGQLLALPLDLDAGALNVEAGHGAGARGLLGEGEIAAARRRAPCAPRRPAPDRRRADSRAAPTWRLGLARHRLLAVAAASASSVGGRDARELREVDQRNGQRRGRVALIARQHLEPAKAHVPLVAGVRGGGRTPAARGRTPRRRAPRRRRGWRRPRGSRGCARAPRTKSSSGCSAWAVGDHASAAACASTRSRIGTNGEQAREATAGRTK